MVQLHPKALTLSLLLSSFSVAVTSESTPLPSSLTLQFTTILRAASGYGHDGDGCILALEQLTHDPTVQHIAFDAKAKKIAQTNLNLFRVDPNPNLTVVGDFSHVPVPIERDLLKDASAKGGVDCQTELLPNGTFGTWGQLFTPFTDVLGMFYPNTTLLSKNTHSDTWQYTALQINVPIPVNDTIHYFNITRNYTYEVSTQPYINDDDNNGDATFPLLRVHWTQSIPLEPALPIHRDCFVFDFTKNYVPGPVDDSLFEPPPNVTCTPRTTTTSKSKKPPTN